MNQKNLKNTQGFYARFTENYNNSIRREKILLSKDRSHDFFPPRSRANRRIFADVIVYIFAH